MPGHIKTTEGEMSKRIVFISHSVGLSCDIGKKIKNFLTDNFYRNSGQSLDGCIYFSQEERAAINAGMNNITRIMTECQLFIAIYTPESLHREPLIFENGVINSMCLSSNNKMFYPLFFEYDSLMSLNGIKEYESIIRIISCGRNFLISKDTYKKDLTEMLDTIVKDASSKIDGFSCKNQRDYGDNLEETVQQIFDLHTKYINEHKFDLYFSSTSKNYISFSDVEEYQKMRRLLN